MSKGTEAFSGFRPTAFEFFTGLRDNNDPEWFKPRKAIYEGEVLTPFRALITAVSAALDDIGIPLSGDPKRSIFRIYRDVRFSPDKRLYKTHAGAVLTRSGSKRDPGLLYLHVEPAASMVGAGFWHPESGILTRLRRSILAEPDTFVEMADRMITAGSPITSDERLSRLPRGFDAAKGTAAEAYVCFKSFTAHAAISDIEMQSAVVVDRIVGFARLAQPLLEWGWDAIDEEASSPITIPELTHPLPKPDF